MIYFIISVTFYWLACVCMIGQLALSRNRSVPQWTLGAIIGGPGMVLLLWALPRHPNKAEIEAARNQRLGEPTRQVNTGWENPWAEPESKAGAGDA